MVICLERGADRLVLPFWYRLTPVVPEKGPLNVCVCVCVCVCASFESSHWAVVGLSVICYCQTIFNCDFLPTLYFRFRAVD